MKTFLWADFCHLLSALWESFVIAVVGTAIYAAVVLPTVWLTWTIMALLGYTPWL